MKLAGRLTLVLGSLAASVRAHDTWLQPERPAATPGATLELGLTRAENFDGPVTAVPPDRLALVRGRLAGEAILLAPPVPGEKLLRFAATLPRPGVAVIGLALKPRVRELAPAEIEPYLRAIHADDSLRAAWLAVPEPRQWRELAAKHAKTFVRVGEPPAGDQAWAQPIGLRLEIVPERDPTALQVGDRLPVRVLRDGEPVAGFTLAFVSAGETREHVAVTDETGRAQATLDVRGKWLVHGTELRRTTAAGREWESDGTTMVIDVR